MRLKSPVAVAWPQGPVAEPRLWVSGQQAMVDPPRASAAASASPGGAEPGRARSKMAPWAAVPGEEGISHLLNELIRAQRFHFEEAAGLSLISVALDLQRSGGEGAISNTCSPGGLTAGKWLGLTSPPAKATVLRSKVRAEDEWGKLFLLLSLLQSGDKTSFDSENNELM